MSRFLPTIDIEPAAVTAALHNGNLKLQPGQWIRCGPGNPSRFSHATKSTIYAVHPEGAMGAGKTSPEKFRMLREIGKSAAN